MARCSGQRRDLRCRQEQRLQLRGVVGTSFCPSCGTARTGAFRFCRACGLDLETLSAPPPAVPPPAAPAAGSAWTAAPGGLLAATRSDPATLRLLTVLAWLGSSVCTGWLALVQFGFVGTLDDPGSLLAMAAWNALIALLVGYGAIRLSRATRPSSFRQSAVYAVALVLLQGFQVVQGATHVAYIGSTGAAAAAGVLSWLAYHAVPPDAHEALEAPTPQQAQRG